MGLGKTVVALALILKHPPAPEHQQQQRQAGAVHDASAAWPTCGGTLIAATPALMGQWESEVPHLSAYIHDCACPEAGRE